MNRALTLLTLIFSLSSVSAQAYTYVKCGKSLDDEGFEVLGYEMELSSESDEYSGAVGGNWNLKLLNEDSPWLPLNKKIVANKTEDENGNTNISIKIIRGRSASGNVGIEYKLFDLYNEEPTLKKYSMGGMAGSIELASFKCLSGNM